MSPEQTEIERKAWLSWFANRGPDEPGTSCAAWLARAEKAERVREALERLLEDTQHSKHNCGDENCPVAAARAALKENTHG